MSVRRRPDRRSPRGEANLEGKVELDAPIQRYLPGVVAGNGYDGTKISVRQILQHTSGISDKAGNPRANPDGTHSLREAVRAGLTNPPLFAPGTSWKYSNTNFLVAGMLIEQITGTPAGDAITARIIKPLGLTRTSYPRGGDRKLEAPYLPGYIGGRVGPFFLWTNATTAVELTAFATAGAMASTEQDMVTFDQAWPTASSCHRRCWPRCARQCPCSGFPPSCTTASG